MKLGTDREKAAFILGMVRAWEVAEWPDHFGAEDRDAWRDDAYKAIDVLRGGDPCPSLSELADDELHGEL